MAHDVFICYSSVNRNIADSICAALEARSIRCWIAPRDVQPGQPWSGELVQAISESRIFLLVLSIDSNRSPQVLREVSEAADRRIPIIPFRIDEVIPSDEIGYYLKPLHWLDAFPPPLDAHIAKLIVIIQELLAGGAISSSTPPPPSSARFDLEPRKKNLLPKVLWLVGALVFIGLAVLGTTLILPLFSREEITPTPPSATLVPAITHTGSGASTAMVIPTFPVSATRVVFDDKNTNFTLKYPHDWEITEKTFDRVVFRYEIFSNAYFSVYDKPMPGKVGDEGSINSIYQAAVYSGKSLQREVTLLRKGYWTGTPFVPANYVEVSQPGANIYFFIHAPIDSQHYVIVSAFKPDMFTYGQLELETLSQMIASIKVK